jgi:hypothetical protein
MKEKKMESKSDEIKHPVSVYACEPLLVTMLGGREMPYWKLPEGLTKHEATNAHEST